MLNTSLLNDYDAVRRTIYGEARGESFQGQVAVGWVIQNRARSHVQWWGRGYAGVCHADRQFSCWNKDDPNLKKILVATEESPLFLQCCAAAAAVLTDSLPDPTMGATHYFADYIAPPKWAAEMTFLLQIGRHKFYRQK